MPLTMNTLIDIFPKERRGSVMGTVGIIIAFYRTGTKRNNSSSKSWLIILTEN